MKAAEATRLRVAESIIDLVGETPILKLRRVVPSGAADVFVKLEYLNPGGSVKDRAAIGIIRRAERDGLLRPGSTIVEATAGNTGTTVWTSGGDSGAGGRGSTTSVRGNGTGARLAGALLAGAAT